MMMIVGMWKHRGDMAKTSASADPRRNEPPLVILELTASGTMTAKKVHAESVTCDRVNNGAHEGGTGIDRELMYSRCRSLSAIECMTLSTSRIKRTCST